LTSLRERPTLLAANVALSGAAAAGRSLVGRSLGRGHSIRSGKEFQMKRLSGVTAALILGMLALAGTADATKPFMERNPDFGGTLPDTCSFPILIQPTAPDVGNLFVFSDGEVMGNGPFVGTATNLDTEKTVTINLSGSHSIVQDSDGTVTVTSHGAVLSSLFGTIFHGTTVIQFDANGVVSRTFHGTEEDLCAELAGP
jgi:hypothetical protein